MRCSSKPKPLLRFPDPSFAVTRLLRAGEYTSERPDDMAPGHLGLAAKDYAYSTAPKRRYTSLITQRLLEAAIASRWTRCTGKHFATEENAALHSIVIVSGRPDIEVRLDLPGQLLGFARLFGRSASRHVKRRDKGISTYLNVASLYSKWREPAIFAFGRALAKVPHHNGSLMVLTSSIVGMRHDS